MAKQYVMINDIIEEHNARMYNLRKYYPFFVLSETAFTQYRDGRYNSLDMGYITMAVLRKTTSTRGTSHIPSVKHL